MFPVRKPQTRFNQIQTGVVGILGSDYIFSLPPLMHAYIMFCPDHFVPAKLGRISNLGLNLSDIHSDCLVTPKDTLVTV
jgi:hypothetical protein